MGLFDKIKEPIFLKESSSASAQLSELQALAENAPIKIKAQIEQDIKTLNAGIYGEENIAFELRNSHMPMIVLHDLYLVHGDLFAQIDYLIITRKRNFVIESKNLIGNIEINSNGDFIRTVDYYGKKKKEGIYSPITQNQRHLEIIKKIRSENKGNFLTRGLFEKYFYENYRSIVVLANPKTILNDKYAKKEVKQQVIRADQLITFIKKVNSEAGSEAISEQQMEGVAQFYYAQHRENPTDYTKKYRLLIEEEITNLAEPAAIDELSKNTTVSIGQKAEPNKQGTDDSVPVCPKCGAPMVKRKATRGPNAGSEFYGCSTYPKCRSIINIEQEKV